MIQYGEMLDLTTSRGTVIGLGRVKVPKMPKLGFSYEIPLLSFVMIEKNGGDGYIATCIHLQIDGYGSTMHSAENDMVDGVLHYLYENFKYPEYAETAWDNLYDLFKSNPRSDILWNKYHALQLGFAKNDITTDRYSNLHERIKSLEERVSELEKSISEKDAALSAFRDSYLSEIMGSMVIEYKGAK